MISSAARKSLLFSKILEIEEKNPTVTDQTSPVISIYILYYLTEQVYTSSGSLTQCEMILLRIILQILISLDITVQNTNSIYKI